PPTVAAHVRSLLEPTTLRGSPVLAVSAVSGSGLDELRAALVALRDRLPQGPAGGLTRLAPDPRLATPPAGGVTRLAIDRVFTIGGRGTVVTGTLRGAPVARGATLRVAPGP